MSRDGSVTFTWADGEYTFRLKLAQLRELQEKCDAGPAEIYRRIVSATWRVDELRETIRLGLIGGGLKPDAALKLVTRYCDEFPLFDSVLPAQVILMAALTGAKDEQPGKSEAAEGVENPSESFQMESSLSPHFTESVQ